MKKKNERVHITRPVILAMTAALASLVVFGAGYRYLAFEIFRLTREPVKLPKPLTQFPTQLADWSGSDVPLSEAVRKIAGNDDYINRQYRNLQTGDIVNLYIAFTGRPGMMKGHEPQACYRGAGWYPEGIEERKMKSVSGRVIDCLIHHFHRIVPTEEKITILHFYIVNGKISVSERTFSGLNWRSPLAFGSTRYVAQIQIAGPVENAVLAAGQLFADEILGFFPDENKTTPNEKP